MSTIYINGYFMINDKGSGTSRFAWQSLLALDSLLSMQQQNKFHIVIVIPRIPGDIMDLYLLKNIRYVYYGNFRNQYLWEQINLAWFTRGAFLINLCNLAPIFKYNQLCVIHDILTYKYPNSYSKKFVLLTKLCYTFILKRSKYIATVSEFSRNEIISTVGHPKNKIIILKNSAENFNNYLCDLQILGKYNLRPQSYILAVFSQKKSFYKNIDRFLLAMSEIDAVVVCVGNVDHSYFASNKLIKNIGYVSNNELKALYSNAFVFIFPSLYEGFGIPPLEAMTCGCPVIASDIPVLREVCGNGAIYFDPYSIKDMIYKIQILRENANNLRMKLINQGYVCASQYRWKDNALKLLEIIT